MAEPPKGEQVGRLTKVIHRSSYPALDPTRPEVSQAGKTVLVTGGFGLIGSSIAGAFVEAGATTVVLVGRRADALEKAAAELIEKFADRKLKAIGISCDVTKSEDVDRLWKKLEQDGIFVDVLVHAAGIWNYGRLLDLGTETIWQSMAVNSYSTLIFLEKLYKQAGHDKGKPLVFIHVSTTEAYDFGEFNNWPMYSFSKNSATLAAQLVAREVRPEELQIINFHPGLLHSNLFNGFLDNLPPAMKDALVFSEPSLCSHFAVWAASPEARFIHGRFVWAAWDLDELRSGPIRERIDSDPRFLQLGVHGL